MRGVAEHSTTPPVCRVEQSVTARHFRGKLSIQGYGTRYTSDYPDPEDARAALVDMRREVMSGVHMPIALLCTTSEYSL